MCHLRQLYLDVVYLPLGLNTSVEQGMAACACSPQYLGG